MFLLLTNICLETKKLTQLKSCILLNDGNYREENESSVIPFLDKSSSVISYGYNYWLFYYAIMKKDVQENEAEPQECPSCTVILLGDNSRNNSYVLKSLLWPTNPNSQWS